MQTRSASNIARKVVLGLLLLQFAACTSLGGPYEESFDDAGKWGTGEDLEASGEVTGGRYEFLVKADLGLFWATAGEQLSDGVYQVEATQLDGPLDNGYGLMFRVDADTNSLYLFEVSGDGSIWIGV